jgi:hypothetical protein
MDLRVAPSTLIVAVWLWALANNKQQETKTIFLTKGNDFEEGFCVNNSNFR